MDVSAFEFDLPADLIAQEPSADRGGSRLLVLERETGRMEHAAFASLPHHLLPGDLLVVNNSRVYPARLLGHRMPSGGAVECLLVRRCGDELWEALVHPGQKLKPGARVVFEGVRTLHGEILERRFYGRRLLRLWDADGGRVDDAIDAIGHVPLPPYIRRTDRPDDRDRYQTVFAHRRGSIAAPTAGLHFTAAMVEALRVRGIDVVSITLHVGYGTFQPVRTERVEDHQIEAEHYEVDPVAAQTIDAALAAGRRIVAVGTTTTRTLEAAARSANGRVAAGSSETDLFIFPGFEFRVVRGLITNFHLPKSSLLMLVAAFAGRDRILAAYRAAVERRYRFYSYGDAMLIV
jgi:S-adenosylmethionine:tRNA ribosyltransferase-isomerase